MKKKAHFTFVKKGGGAVNSDTTSSTTTKSTAETEKPTAPAKKDVVVPTRSSLAPLAETLPRSSRSPDRSHEAPQRRRSTLRSNEINDIPEEPKKKEKKAPPKKVPRSVEQPKTPFDEMCTDVRHSIHSEGFKQELDGDRSLIRCCRVAISRFERQLFYEWTSMTTGRANRLESTNKDGMIAESEREAKLKSIAVETAAAETALMKLDAELAAWQNVLDRHKLVIPGLEGMREASKRVHVEDPREVDEMFALPVPKIDTTVADEDSDEMRDSSPEIPTLVSPLRAVVSAIDHSSTVIADAQVAVESAQMQLPRLVQQEISLRLQKAMDNTGAVPTVSQLVPIVP